MNVADNFLPQKVEESIKGLAILSLLLTNRENVHEDW